MTERQVPLEVAQLRAIPMGTLMRAFVWYDPGESSPGAYEVVGPLRQGSNGVDIFLGKELVIFVPDHRFKESHCDTCQCPETHLQDKDFIINPAILALSQIEEVEAS